MKLDPRYDDFTFIRKIIYRENILFRSLLSLLHFFTSL